MPNIPVVAATGTHAQSVVPIDHFSFPPLPTAKMNLCQAVRQQILQHRRYRFRVDACAGKDGGPTPIIVGALEKLDENVETGTDGSTTSARNSQPMYRCEWGMT